MARQQKELYEILAKRRPSTVRYGSRQREEKLEVESTIPEADGVVYGSGADEGSSTKSENALNAPESARLSPEMLDDDIPVRTVGPSDLVVSNELALSIFLVAVVMIGTAFVLGIKKGRTDITANLAAQAEKDRESIENVSGVALPNDFSETRPQSMVIPENSYVLRIAMHERTQVGLSRARADRDYAAKADILQKIPVKAFVLGNDKAFSVCLGPLATKYDPRFDKLKRIFQGLPGPPTSTERRPYKSFANERVSELGKLFE